MNNIPTHLLSSLGVLASFSIGKRISKDEISKVTNKIKKVYKEKNPEKFQKLLIDVLINKTRKRVGEEMPPGFIFPEKNPKKEHLDRFYMELSAISQALSNKFLEQKLTKHQVCFIVNALVNILGIGESDFESFHRKFSKYKENDFSDDDEEE
jgi:hypothetical protein